MLTKIWKMTNSVISTAFWLPIFLIIFGFIPFNFFYSCSLWVGGNFSYGKDLDAAISSFKAGDRLTAENFMQKAKSDAENYPMAIGPDAGNDLAHRVEMAGNKGLKNTEDYALAAFLYGYARNIRSQFSEKKSLWPFERYFAVANDSKQESVDTLLNSARAFNLAKQYELSEAILVKLSNEIASKDNRSPVEQFFNGSKKIRLSINNRQKQVLIETELVDAYQQNGKRDLADEETLKVLEFCKSKRISPSTLKECAKRFKEMGRDTDALLVYEELQKTHYDEDDDDDD